MANLETLELTISANAQSASQGVASLTSSLSALSKAVSMNVGGLRSLNAELGKLKGVGNIKIGNIGKVGNASSTRAIKAQTKALTDSAKATQTWAEAQAAAGYPLTANNVPRGQRGGGFYNWSNVSTRAWNFKPLGEGSFDPKYGRGERWNPYYNPVSAGTNGRASEFFQQAQAMEEAGKAAESYQKKTSSAFTKVGRIASTMLIRTALRGLIKAFGEAWNSVYEFSKATGGEFAKSMDTISGLLKGAAINLTSAFAPAISALLPVINAVAAAVNYLAGAIKWLFSLLGLGAGLFGATADQIGAIGGAAGGSGSKVKEMLASFDELNVISQESGGGGGGGGGGNPLSGMISDEMAAITVLAGEAMLALGLILAFTGHPFIGGALIALGVAGIVGTVATKWGTLTDEIKGQIVTIMAIAGTAFLALGLILTLSGANVPLGIGLMIAGIGNLAGSVALSWGLDQQIKNKIAIITAAVGGALLAIGAILAFTGANVPLGIGLMVAGAVGLASSVALTWSLDVGIMVRIAQLTAIIGGALLALGAAIAFTGANIPLGIGLMVAGAVSLATSAALAWNLDGDVANKIYALEAIVGGAFLAIGAILAFTGANLPLGIALMAAGGVSLAAAIAPNWDYLSQKIQKVFKSIGDFIVSTWETIEEAITSAWVAVSDWFDTNIVRNVSAAWDAVSRFFSSLWKDITSAIDSAWKIVSDWWGDILGKVTGAWNTVASFFSGLWRDISSWVTNAWDTVSKWWENGIGKRLSKAWESFSSTISSVFEPVVSLLSTAWDFISKILSIDGKTVAVNTDVTVNYSVPTGHPIGYNSGPNDTNYRMEYAEGGFPTRGQVFIANEAGAELIGNIGGHTAVASNDMIIDGITEGVRDANMEQNALLRQQNELLRAILAKDNGISPSVGLGRTVRQSLDLYSRVGG